MNNMNFKMFFVSMADRIVFMLLRGLHFIMCWTDSFFTQLWYIVMFLLLAANVWLLFGIRKNSIRFGHASIISGIAAGTAVCYAVSFLMNKLVPYGFIVMGAYVYGIYMYDGFDPDTVRYIAQTCGYIYSYNIISYIIVKYRKPERNVYTVIIHNPRQRAVCGIKLLIGAEKYLFDNIDRLEPGESIKKTIVIDDSIFLSKIKPP